MGEAGEIPSDDVLRELTEDVDYWYQVTQALLVRLVRQHLPLDTVEKLVSEVELDAVNGFELTNRPRLNLELSSRLVTSLYDRSRKLGRPKS